MDLADGLSLLPEMSTAGWALHQHRPRGVNWRP